MAEPHGLKAQSVAQAELNTCLISRNEICAVSCANSVRRQTGLPSVDERIRLLREKSVPYTNADSTQHYSSTVVSVD